MLFVCLVGFSPPGLAVHIHTNAPCIFTSLLKYAHHSFELVNKDICSNGRGNRGFSWLPNRIGNCSDAEVCLEKPEKCRKDKTVAGSVCGLTDTGRARPLPWEEIHKGRLPEGISLSPVHPAGAGISGQ